MRDVNFKKCGFCPEIISRKTVNTTDIEYNGIKFCSEQCKRKYIVLEECNPVILEQIDRYDKMLKLIDELKPTDNRKFKTFQEMKFLISSERMKAKDSLYGRIEELSRELNNTNKL